MASPAFAREAENEPEPRYLYRIYLTIPTQRLPLIIRITRLAVWGSRMYERVRIEMTFYACLLAVIALFDVAAWSLLFNQILTGGTVEAVLTSVSIVLGSAMAFLFYMYERQVVVYDTSRGYRSLLSAFAFRIVVVFLGALLTAQPVELLLFRKPIQRRIHEESLRAEIARANKWKVEAKNALAEAKKEGDLNPIVYFEGQRNKAVKEAEAANHHKVDTQNALNRAQQRVDSARRKLNSIDRDIPCYVGDDQCPNRRQQAKEARSIALSNAIADLGKKRNDKEEAASTAEFAQGESEKKVKEYNREFQTRIADPQKRVDQWIKQLQDPAPGSKDRAHATNLFADQEENSREEANPPLKISVEANKESEHEVPWSFSDQNFDFVQKRRMLQDLVEGLPPHWPGASPEQIKQWKSEHSMNDSDDQAESKVISFAYYVVYGLALLIPLMSFAFKLLMPEELANYYSVKFQDSMGNPEAQLYLANVRRIKSDDEKL